MIDTNQLSALISAFRVETEKESISPETVGKLLQDITDLLENASTDAERQILDDWKNLLSQYYFIYDVADANMPDQQNIFLRLRARSLGDGTSLSSSVPIAGATDMKAGAMTATHVRAITTLQSLVSQLQTAVAALQTSATQHGEQLFSIQTAGYVVTSIVQGDPHSSRVNLRVIKHDVRTGEQLVYDGTSNISAATAEKAGVMTAQQCNSLNVAKTDITALQAALRKVQGAGAVVDGASVFHIASDRVGIRLFGYNLATGEGQIELQDIYLAGATQNGAGVMTTQQVKQLDALRQAVFGTSTSSSKIKPFHHFGIEIKKGKDALFLRGVSELLASGYVPYLFRYSSKRNRIIISGIKEHGPIKKGWNVLGNGDTIQIRGDGAVCISKKVLKHPEIDTEEMEELADYQCLPQFFISDRYDQAKDERFVTYGKARVDVIRTVDGVKTLRKVRLLYGIAFATYKVDKRQLLDKSKLVTPIVPFHIATDRIDRNSNDYRWIFER